MLSFSDYAKANRWSEMVFVVWQEYQADGDIRARLGSVTAVVSVLWLLALRGQKRHIFSKETVTISPNKCEIHLFPQGVFYYIKSFRFFFYTQKKRATSSCVHLLAYERLRACNCACHFVYKCVRTLQQRV